MAKFTSQQLQQWGLSPQSLPRHVAIVMDGNGRWAQEKGRPRTFGHRAGTERLREIIRFSSDAGIGALTLYAFSTENWRRPEEEKSVLFSLLVEYFSKEIDELHENNVRITIFGEKDPFPQKVCQALVRAEERTRDNTGLRLNIALNYGSRAEICRAVRLCCEESAKTGAYPGDEAFEQHLYSAGQPELDLLIRTGGEQRLSNFLLYQAAYAELYFTPVFWPDFTREEYILALQAFQKRARRFGGL
ncbi:MAG: di-trans,poly-cis-decaprenylcistransferase [Clostridia bacterium]|nr:di-trans,poly-cis-decaprenylcistransferase [Clostridia bacterium]